MADATVSNVLYGYPAPWANKKAFSIDWTGPTLYATGGVTLSASQLGIGGIDMIIGGASQSGTYFAVGRPLGDGSRSSCKIQVFVASSGAEAGAIDLDAEIFRLGVVGE